MADVLTASASPPPIRRTRLLASLVAVVILIAATVIWLIDRSSADSTASSNARRTSVSGPAQLSTDATDFGGIELRVPVGWRVVDPDFVTAALVQPLGWITNAADLLPECRPHEQLDGHVSCGAPVDQLDDGGVLVFASIGPAFDDFVANDTVAGLPARESVTDGSDCLPGATSGFNVSIKDADSVVGFWMCFGPNSDAARAAARDMIGAATYHHG